MVVVETVSGKLRGSSLTSCQGDDYYAFKGIPYAKTPVGSLRFADPEPMEAWEGIRDTIEHGQIAAQIDIDTKLPVGSENCLYLNVYTKNVGSKNLAPVMVYVHGGAFIQRSGNDDYYGPDYLLMKNVVIVTINYRLGIFGFLNLKDKVATGNQAFKDQVMALQWIKMNITNFGGDSENVTIFGGSAGGASIHYLTLSPLARGLFHRAICQSGTALNPWGTKKDPLKSVYEVLELLNYKNRDPKAIVEFLRTVDCYKLIEIQQTFITPSAWLQCYFPFGPCVDDISDNPFMPVPITVAAEKGTQVPLMIGFTSAEGLFTLNFTRMMNMKDVNENFRNYVYPRIEELLGYYNTTLEDVRRLYFGNEEISESNLDKLVKLLGDLYFVEGIHRYAKIQVRNSRSPTFLYKFSFDNNITLSRKDLNSKMRGANHGDELSYLFKANVCDALNFKQFQEKSGGDRMMKLMVELWTNFARTGLPTPELSELLPIYWQPLDNHAVLRYFHIDENLRMDEILNIEEVWSKNVLK